LPNSPTFSNQAPCSSTASVSPFWTLAAAVASVVPDMKGLMRLERDGVVVTAHGEQCEAAEGTATLAPPFEEDAVLTLASRA
jgi:hypothetical protein